MDAGSHSISSGKNSAAAVQRPPLQEAGSRPYMPPLSTTSRSPAAKCYVSRLLRPEILRIRSARELFDGMPD